jgi:hypothetical protein
MIRRMLFAFLAVALALVCGRAQAQEVQYAGYEPQAINTVMMDPGAWHAGYSHTAWGQPVALVIPPTVTHQTNWGWGIGNTRITPVFPQYNGPMTAGPSQYPYGPHRPTPYYVSDTLHFGVYYIRGPW